MSSPAFPELYADLEARGIVKQVTDATLAVALRRERLTVYAGFDPTSDSLHVGSLLPLLTLRRFQQAGHAVIAVVGGATGMVGDPSGKADERSLLDEPTLARNVAGITAVVGKFLELGGANPARIVNNADFFKGMTFIEFLRDVGKHFTVNHMIAKESVRARLEDREHGISYTEFSYMLLQAYDFHRLHEDAGCRLQIGGSDQWGNITAGTELIRRMSAAHGKQDRLEREPVYGLTHPLITKSDGTKFGKTERGTVWLDAGRTSPYQFYQFFLQSADADAGPWLKCFSFRPVAELEGLERAHAASPEKREAQRALARDLTALVHGEEALARVERASQAFFATQLKDLDAESLLDALSDAPATRWPRARLTAGLPLVDALAECGLCPSKGAARKDLAGGGISVNNERASDPAASLEAKDLIAGRFIVLRRGKKSYHLLAFEGP